MDDLKHRVIELGSAIHEEKVGIAIKIIRQQLMDLSSEFLFWEVSGEQKYTDIYFTVTPRFSNGDVFIEPGSCTISTNTLYGSGVDIMNQLASCMHLTLRRVGADFFWSGEKKRDEFHDSLEKIRSEQ